MSSLRFLLRAACVVLVAVAATDARAADVVIHEFLAANSGVHLDGDGDAPDWIELYNTTVSPVQLGGWYLTDRAADLTKWRFPDVTLPAGGYLVIFASGKDRSGPELHTNFKLDMDGEYLALVRPDGATVEHEFAPAFPPQRRDISYGMTTETTVLVGNDVLVDVLVPTGAVPAGTWELPGFIPGPGWLTGVPVPVGYHVEDEGGTGFEAAAYWSLDGTLAEWHGVSDGRFFGGAQPTYTEGFDGKPQGALLLDGTDDYVEIPAGGACPVFNLPAYTVAMWVKGLPQPDYRVYSEGSGSSNSPLFNIGTDNTGATGAVDIYIRTDSGDAVVSHVKSQGMAFDGTWHHIAWVDAGGNAALYIDGVRDPVNFNYSKPRLTLDKVAIGAVLRSAPTHWFQGAIDEVAVWDFALTPDEIAELAAGARPSGGAAFRDAIATDLEDVMKGRTATAYVRFPFHVTDPHAFSSLLLGVKYDDGFVAYLNGSEVARRNAPATLTWQSAATAERPNREALRFEVIPLAPSLVSGLNVLAFQGLNLAADDGDFLLGAELIAVTAYGYDMRYMLTPTPGGPNSAGYTDFAADPVFTPPRGFYEEPIDVEISTATEGASLYYSIDGTEPTPETGIPYTGPVRVTTTAMLRAAAFRDDLLPSLVMTHTYLYLDDVIRQTGAGYPTDWGSHPIVYALYPSVVNAYEDTIREDLRSIPTLSLVLPIPDVFGGARGIYPNATQRGLAWERRTSAEFIHEDGGTGFQVDCGVRMHGGSSRNWTSTPKHSFRLKFRGSHGPRMLRYRLFPESPVAEFRTLVLRACYTDGWGCRYSEPRYRPTDSQYLRDQWMRDAQLAMGSLSAHGTFVHLYVAGLYWGLYNIAERPDAVFASSHYGGEREEYDALKDRQLSDGSREAWNTMIAIANAGVASDVAYRRLQEYLDVDNLIDYMILQLFGGAEDWPHQNWAAARHRVEGAGYRFFSWDQEIVLDVINRDYSAKDYDDSPARLHQRLRANSEYRLRFADRVRRHLFNDGVLTPSGCIELYTRRTAEIDRAVVGESAMWGNYRRTPAFTRDIEWVAARDWILNQYFPQRTAVMIAQFRSTHLYPALDAPDFSGYGGVIDPGYVLSMSGPGGVAIYYTLDGTDPRQYLTGDVAPGAYPYSMALSLQENVHVKARARSGATWSALTEAVFRIRTSLDDLRITEIMYNPPGGAVLPGEAYEFIELKNTGPHAVDLTGVRLTRAVRYTFPEGTVLGPGGFLVVAADVDAFRARYPGVGAVAGPFQGRLRDDGERVVLRDPDGEALLDFYYSDRAPWPRAAAGGGHSLVARDLDGAGDPGRAEYWRDSTLPGGSPGADDPGELPPGGLQLSGDFNQDGRLDISDAISMLRYLFGGEGIVLPCGNGTAADPANLTLLDVNGDEMLNLGDAVYMLGYLFASGPAPILGVHCVPIEGCAHVCRW